MKSKPIGGDPDNLVKRAWFLEKMGGPGDDMHVLDAVQLGEGVLVEFQHSGVGAANNEQSRRANLRQSVTGEVWAAATRYDRRDFRILGGSEK